MKSSEELDSEALNLYLNEVKDFQQHAKYTEDEQVLLDEIEQVTDFLQKAGLSNLSAIHLQGHEITETVVNDIVHQNNLTQKQAQTIKSRVKTLNRTLRSHQPRVKQRQDIRDVSWKNELDNFKTSSTGTRSRSATPDSLDSSNEAAELDSHSKEEQSSSLPYLSLDSGNLVQKTKSKWSSDDQVQNKVFTTTKYDRGDIAHLLSDTVVLKGYHPITESSVSKSYRERSGSDPSTEIHFQEQNQQCYADSNDDMNKNIVSDFDNNSSIINENVLSFESLIQKSENKHSLSRMWKSDCSLNTENIYIDEISDSEYQYLKSFLWVEIIALFDQYNVTILKRKSNAKNKRGNVFGVNLSTLVMRDMPRFTDNSMVPQIFQLVINQLNSRCLKEDGILRIGGQKQKLEKFYNEIETKFYDNRAYVENLLKQATTHELVGVLKKLLRDLPDPIFTMELFDMFYKCNSFSKQDQFKALNLLVLLLPVEHRNTFHLLLKFLNNVIKYEKDNHMTLHNVAMVTAPSFFPPRLLLPKETKMQVKSMQKEDLIKHINDAAICCCIMETLLKSGSSLWMVPIDLVKQARDALKKVQDRKENKSDQFKSKKKLQRSSTQYQPGIMVSPVIKNDIFM